MRERAFLAFFGTNGSRLMTHSLFTYGLPTLMLAFHRFCTLQPTCSGVNTS